MPMNNRQKIYLVVKTIYTVYQSLVRIKKTKQKKKDQDDSSFSLEVMNLTNNKDNMCGSSVIHVRCVFI